MLRKLYAVVPSCARMPTVAERATAAMVSMIFPVIFIVGGVCELHSCYLIYNETLAANSIQVKRFLDFADQRPANVKKH